MNKRLSIALPKMRDAEMTGAQKDVARADIGFAVLLNPSPS
ncbi:MULTISPECIES: hypothetical protein [Bradyrhizobium]|nr:hypothetical protein [Bradyrhizobium cosmicum]